MLHRPRSLLCNIKAIPTGGRVRKPLKHELLSDRNNQPSTAEQMNHLEELEDKSIGTPVEKRFPRAHELTIACSYKDKTLLDAVESSFWAVTTGELC